MKRTSEVQNLPYRKFPIRELGAISPLKPKSGRLNVTLDDAEDENENVSEVNGEICAGADSEHAWYHGSNLTCQICSKTFANDQWYFHHFSKIHGMTKEQYNEQYGKELEIWHQYQCLICNSEIRSKIY